MPTNSPVWEIIAYSYRSTTSNLERVGAIEFHSHNFVNHFWEKENICSHEWVRTQNNGKTKTDKK